MKSEQSFSGGSVGPHWSDSLFARAILGGIVVVALRHFLPTLADSILPSGFGFIEATLVIAVLHLALRSASGFARVLAFAGVLGSLVVLGPVIRPWLKAVFAGLPESKTIESAVRNVVEARLPTLSPADLIEKLVELEADKPAKAQDLFGPSSPKTTSGIPQWLADASKIEQGVCETFVFLHEQARYKGKTLDALLLAGARAWTEFFSDQESKYGTTTPLGLKALLSAERGSGGNQSLTDDIVRLLSVRVAEAVAFSFQFADRAPEDLAEVEATIQAFTESEAAVPSDRLAETRQRSQRRDQLSIQVQLIMHFNVLADRLKQGRVSLQKDSGATQVTAEAELRSVSETFYEPLTTGQYAEALKAIRALQERVGPEPKAAAEGVEKLQARLAEIGSISEHKAFVQAADTLMIDARLELELLDRLIDAAAAGLPITKRGQFEAKVTNRKTSMKAALQGAPSIQLIIATNGSLDLDSEGFEQYKRSSVELIAGFLSSVKYYQDFLTSLKEAQGSVL